MTGSLGRTLALRFAATMAVGLAGVAAAAFWAASRVMEGELHQSLTAAAFLTETRFRALTADTGAVAIIVGDPAQYGHDVNRYAVLRAADGRVLRALPGYAFDLPLDSVAFAAARAGEPKRADHWWHGALYRSLYYPVQGLSGPGDQVIQIAASLGPLRAVQRDLLLALGALILLGGTATLVGAWAVVGSAMRPVQEITMQATHIEAGTLDQRIAAHADTDEYRGLVAVLNRMLERLERGFTAQRRLTADMSHELRTPLTALRGEIEVALRADRSPREYQHVLRSALEETERLSGMAEDLLLITRAESHLLRPEIGPHDLNQAVRAALVPLRRRVAEKGLSMDSALAEDLPPVPVDAELLARLVAALLDNAVKYAPPEGTVRVMTEHSPGGAHLVVADSGPGIAPTDLPHVFEPFYRADQARTRGDGTGLGLALAAAIVRVHGGRIAAGSAPQGGAQFDVVLPYSVAN
jgi:signal transduction histidine kinase